LRKWWIHRQNKWMQTRITKAVFGVLFLLSVALPLSAAETIEVPDDELAQESVSAKFERPDPVKNRNVITNGKFELGGYYGFNTLEPIHAQGKFGVNLGYHWNEMSAAMINFAMWNSGLNTQYTDGLATKNLDFTRAPKLKYSIFGHYEWKIWYGKISVTKKGVTNLSTYPIFGLGMTAYDHKNYYGVDVGIGQKFYFGKSFALRADFKIQYSQQPSPFLRGYMRTADPVPSPAQFDDIWDLGTIIDIGGSFLF
jgi:outer membrane beta-barrel protein